MLMKTEGAMKNRQFRETDNTWHTRHRTYKTQDIQDIWHTRHMTYKTHDIQDTWHTRHMAYKIHDIQDTGHTRHMTYKTHDIQDTWHTRHRTYKTHDIQDTGHTRHRTYKTHDIQDTWHTRHRPMTNKAKKAVHTQHRKPKKMSYTDPTNNRPKGWTQVDSFCLLYDKLLVLNIIQLLPALKVNNWLFGISTLLISSSEES